MIFVDRREDKEVETLLRGAYTCTRVDLEFADYSFFGNGPDGGITIGVERKKVGDMLSSIETGRFSGHQLLGLKEKYERVYLIVEGMWVEDRGILRVRGERGRWERKGRTFRVPDLLSFLTSMEEAGVTVRTTDSSLMTALTIGSLKNWWGKEWEKHTAQSSMNKTGVLKVRRASLIERIAVELPGIGKGRAEMVARKFGSVEEMIMAAECEWKEIEGIGKNTAKAVYESIRRKKCQ